MSDPCQRRRSRSIHGNSTGMLLDMAPLSFSRPLIRDGELVRHGVVGPASL